MMKPAAADPPRMLLAAGLAAAVGAAACCFAPLALVMLGAGGAWLASVRALEPLQPLFMVATLIFFGFAFRRLYVTPRQCAPDDACAADAARTRQRASFWVVAAAAAAMLAFPFYAPWFA